MAWKNTNELLEAIQKATQKLDDGKVDTDAAHAMARLLGTAVKVWNIRLDHAKITKRLTEGNADLPDMNIVGERKKGK